MTRFKQLPALALPLFLAGCAALQPEASPERDAALRLEQGLAALEAGHYRESFDDLAWVYSNCTGHEASVHALAALAALELDPRNDAARPDVGVDMLGRLLQNPTPPRWLRPMLEIAYLESLALGAAPTATTRAGADEAPGSGPGPGPERADRSLPAWSHPAGTEQAAVRCGPSVGVSDGSAPALPELPGPTMWSLLVRAEAAQDSLAVRADSLQAQLDRTAQQLRETREELERIRKTLKP